MAQSIGPVADGAAAFAGLVFRVVRRERSARDVLASVEPRFHPEHHDRAHVEAGRPLAGDAGFAEVDLGGEFRETGDHLFRVAGDGGH